MRETWERSMAGDLHALLCRHLGLTRPMTMVGHDIGMMIACAFACRVLEQTERLVVMEAPLPGTSAHEAALSDTDRLWRFQFHRAPDVPELLTASREQLYLERLYQDLAHDTEAIGPDAIQRYVRAFSRPGAMRAGCELYRAFPTDVAQKNRAEIERDGNSRCPSWRSPVRTASSRPSPRR